MANAAERAAKAALDEHSPSRVFMKIGAFVATGFANGIDRMSRMSEMSARDMANSAIKTVSKSVTRIADAINSDVDTQPSIRPVVDLSGVRTGADAINDMLNIGASINTTSNLRAINSMMNRRNQNGTNADVVAAVNKLGKGLNNLGNTSYNINGVNYSADSDIATAIELITRAAIKERRV
jgi:hypothetical protein